MVKNLLLTFLSSSMFISGISLPVLANEKEFFEKMESIIENTNDNESEEINEEITFPEAGSIIHSGKIGTADWTIDSNGTLTIGAGEFENNDSGFVYPWFEYKDEILNVNGTAKLILKGESLMPFFWCSQLVSADLSGWETSLVTNMAGMFRGCTNLKSVNLSNWNTSSVKNMGWMFFNCSKLKSIDLSNWNTSNLSVMYYMFKYCSALEDLNLSNWDISGAIQGDEYEYEILGNCDHLKTLNITGWKATNSGYVSHNLLSKCNSLYQITYTSGAESIISNLPSQRKWYQNDQGPYDITKIPSLLQGAQAILTREDHFDKSNFSTDTPSNGEMYRLYNPNSGEHFYTGNPNEKNQLSSLGWKYEGIAWHSPQSSNTPVYRLYNKNSSDHHYTTDPNEKDTLVRSGWKDEGIGWYSDDQKGIALYRVYNPNTQQAGSHHYTTESNERNILISKGWKDEGIAWYGMKFK